MHSLRIGLALTGSFCTFEKALAAAEELCRRYEVVPIMSETAANTDTRFGRAADFRRRLEDMTGRGIICTIPDAEPIGPTGMLDVLAVAPCTGNTLAKLARGITDTAVTMAVKSQLRGGRPVLLAVSTNDGLAASAKNIGTLLTRKNIYFAPFMQDDFSAKPASLATDWRSFEAAVLAAAEHRQLQPLLVV